jgi:Cft2 family RNA processing exonuclease
MFSQNNFKNVDCFFQSILHPMLIELSLYYVPKVLGAAMFYAKVGDTGIVYTGDYNMTPDRHLGAAQIDRLQLDLLITEYGTCLCKWLM